MALIILDLELCVEEPCLLEDGRRSIFKDHLEFFIKVAGTYLDIPFVFDDVCYFLLEQYD